MIVTVCLSKGAIAMSRKKVIVKRLNSIQNFGAMDVLCTDKTGTLTLDRVILERHCDVVRKEDDGVLAHGLPQQPLPDRAEERAGPGHPRSPGDARGRSRCPSSQKVDEIPFDFSRRLMSVVVETPEGSHRLITKGAPEEVFQRCSSFELDGKVYPMEPLLIDDLKEEYDALSADGFRVLAVAYKDLDRAGRLLQGRRAATWSSRATWPSSTRPRRPPARRIVALQKHGVAVKVLTGDNELVSRKICHEVGLPTDAHPARRAGRDDDATPNWPRRPRRPRSSPASRRPTSSGSSGAPEPASTSSASWATASTTPRRCARPTWASRWTPPWTSPRSPPTSSCWRRA